MPISTRLNTKICLTVLHLSGFEMYSQWVPLKYVKTSHQGMFSQSAVSHCPVGRNETGHKWHHKCFSLDKGVMASLKFPKKCGARSTKRTWQSTQVIDWLACNASHIQ